MNNWQDIVPIFLSTIALLLSFFAELHTRNFERQKEAEPLYTCIQKLLKSKCDYFSSEMKIIGSYSYSQAVTDLETEAIKRKTKRVFGKKRFNNLCDILTLCAKAQKLNFDMGILFDLIKESKPEDYMRLSENLQILESDIPDSEKIEAKKFLSTISIPYYQFIEEEQGKAYDFFELYNQLMKIDIQINKSKKIFDETLQKAMMKS